MWRFKNRPTYQFFVPPCLCVITNKIDEGKNMNLKPDKKNWLTCSLLVVFCLTALIASAQKGEVKVKLGKEIKRDIEDVKKENFVYGLKQDYNPETKETQIFLPYGSNTKLYYEVEGLVTDPETGKCAEIFNTNGQSQNKVIMVYKLVFDKPISSFKYRVGWVELTLGPECAAGVEYSVNGKKWETLFKIKGDGENGIKEPFINGAEATGLNTKTLYLRHFARHADPKDTNPGKWMKIRMSGDPGWGDAAKTFFKNQIMIRVKGK